jgi:hypothetical protein
MFIKKFGETYFMGLIYAKIPKRLYYGEGYILGVHRTYKCQATQKM